MPACLAYLSSVSASAHLTLVMERKKKPPAEDAGHKFKNNGNLDGYGVFLSLASGCISSVTWLRGLLWQIRAWAKHLADSISSSFSTGYVTTLLHQLFCDIELYARFHAGLSIRAPADATRREVCIAVGSASKSERPKRMGGP